MRGKEGKIRRSYWLWGERRTVLTRYLIESQERNEKERWLDETSSRRKRMSSTSSEWVLREEGLERRKERRRWSIWWNLWRGRLYLWFIRISGRVRDESKKRGKRIGWCRRSLYTLEDSNEVNSFYFVRRGCGRVRSFFPQYLSFMMTWRKSPNWIRRRRTRWRFVPSLGSFGKRRRRKRERRRRSWRRRQGRYEKES
jgi:hypothetical protein